MKNLKLNINKRLVYSFTKLVAIYCLLMFFNSCRKFLDASPDKQLTTPNTIQDLRALLDNNTIMNESYSPYGAIASDDYYITDASYNSLTDVVAKNNYPWGLISENANNYSDWLLNYQRLFNVNVVLDNINQVDLNGATKLDVDAIKGEALFYRGYTIFTIAQTYSLPYNPATAQSIPGIPLRLTADINETITRPSLEETYQQIVTDLQAAIPLLPVSGLSLLRPNKPAAYAALANVFMVMQQFDKAENCSDSCLFLKNDLIDYNTISPDANIPFAIFNSEVLWQADLGYNTILATSRSKVDTNFYNSFENNDLRKVIYFKSSSSAPTVFKGHYNGQWHGTSVYFSGLAVDEIYLIKAECEARNAKVSEAMSTLNALLINRYDKTNFVPFNATSSEEAINIILDQRRKELCFRGSLRWTDIRRLNQYGNSQATITRKINDQLYTLKPGDLHFAFLIPQNTIDNSHIKQNER